MNERKMKIVRSLGTDTMIKQANAIIRITNMDVLPSEQNKSITSVTVLAREKKKENRMKKKKKIRRRVGGGGRSKREKRNAAHIKYISSLIDFTICIFFYSIRFLEILSMCSHTYMRNRVRERERERKKKIQSWLAYTAGCKHFYRLPGSYFLLFLFS